MQPVLFSLPEYEQATLSVFGEAVDEFAMINHPILREIERRVVRDVRPSRISEGDDPPLALSTIESSAEIVLDASAIAEGDLGSVYAAVDAVGDAKGGAIVRGMVEHLGQITERTGNAIDAGGRPFSHELFFETLEGMEIDFNEHGEANLQILTSPELGAKMAALPPPTEEQQAQFDALMARKRAEFEARKKTRRLK
jgi:hypothetical protein